MSYTPIDYSNWELGDSARNGVNIKKLDLLNPNELEILNATTPYQDQRNDPGHGELTAYFAIKLLDDIPGTREVVVPAAILHDSGWWGVDPDYWKNLMASEGETEGELKRRPHQNRGCLRAGRVLEQVGYPEAYSNEIADIIGDHDTRKLPVSESGRIVRTADLLWRTTYPLVEIYMPNEDAQKTLRRIEETCLTEELLPHLGEIGTEIARAELVNTILFKFGQQGREVLGPDYAREVQLVERFHKR